MRSDRIQSADIDMITHSVEEPEPEPRSRNLIASWSRSRAKKDLKKIMVAEEVFVNS
jgi:hypothetical protein